MCVCVELIPRLNFPCLAPCCLFYHYAPRPGPGDEIEIVAAIFNCLGNILEIPASGQGFTDHTLHDKGTSPGRRDQYFNPIDSVRDPATVVITGTNWAPKGKDIPRIPINHSFPDRTRVPYRSVPYLRHFCRWMESINAAGDKLIHSCVSHRVPAAR